MQNTYLCILKYNKGISQRYSLLKRFFNKSFGFHSQSVCLWLKIYWGCILRDTCTKTQPWLKITDEMSQVKMTDEIKKWSAVIFSLETSNIVIYIRCFKCQVFYKPSPSRSEVIAEKKQGYINITPALRCDVTAEGAPERALTPLTQQTQA